jgi:protein-arginine kinase activator protein McsA
MSEMIEHVSRAIDNGHNDFLARVAIAAVRDELAKIFEARGDWVMADAIRDEIDEMLKK